MKVNMRKLSLSVFFVLLTCFIWAQSNKFPFQDPKLPLDNRIADLVSRLTLEEKSQQMMNDAPAVKRLSILPYSWWNEALHGVARTGKATVFLKM